MEPSQIPEMIEFIEKTRGPQLCVSFMGGEPMLNMPVIMELTKILKDRYSPAIGFTINTNLSLLTDEYIRFFTDNSFKVEISLDGIRSVHDKNRQDWNKVVSNILALDAAYSDKYGPDHDNTDIIYVVNGDTDKIDKGFSLISKLAANPEIYINYKREWSDEDISNIVKSLSKTPKRHTGGCKISPKHQVTIDVDGNIYWCSRMMYDELSYGNIRDGYINKIAYDKLMDYSINGSITCQSCSAFPKCKGSCLAIHYEVAHDFETVNQTFCNIKKQLAQRSKNE